MHTNQSKDALDIKVSEIDIPRTCWGSINSSLCCYIITVKTLLSILSSVMKCSYIFPKEYTFPKSRNSYMVNNYCIH